MQYENSAFKVDVLCCPCGGRRRVLAFLTDAAEVSKILRHLGLDARLRPLSPPRDLDPQLDLAPPDLDAPAPPGDLDFDADSPCHVDAPFLPDPDPPADDPSSGDSFRDPPPPEEFADPPERPSPRDLRAMRASRWRARWTFSPAWRRWWCCGGEREAPDRAGVRPSILRA